MRERKRGAKKIVLLANSLFVNHNRYPHYFDDLDIVITSYGTLSDDLRRDGVNRGRRNFRGSQKYPILPSPLTLLKFRRVVMDEAQRIESPTSKSAVMACKIPAVSRWAVTGT